ncbi:Uu.00g039610.m01.CDS01 [Anthostomella pinea]|uniref:Uu.00g039610.m01.CDS01 n=1 Tax=Anthostomella pinea TaxID=933095 RepID=A0AAI8YDZ9_9PEZI|nr:Uu.00g039610.m01.CDS01 [Anthostomella pinea]
MPHTLAPLAIGLVLLGILAWYEGKPAEPVFPPHLRQRHGQHGPAVGVHPRPAAVQHRPVTYLPLFYQPVHLQTPLGAGISTLTYSAGTIGMSAISGVVVNLVRRYKLVLLAGWVLSTVFIGLLYTLDGATPRAAEYSYCTLMGIGVGTVLTVTALPAQASVNAARSLSFGSTVFNSGFQNKINAVLATTPDDLPDSLAKFGNNANQALTLIPRLRELELELPREAMDLIIGAYNRPFQVIWLVFTALSGIGLVSAVFIREISMENDEVGRQGLRQ